MTFRLRSLTFLFWLSVSMYGQHNPKIADSLTTKDANSTLKVIVEFNVMPTAAQHQKVISRGGTLKSVLKSIKGGAYTIAANQLNGLANEPDVVRISQDHPVRDLLDYTASAVNAPVAWNSGWDGSGIGVAVIDSGITEDPDLAATGQSGASRVLYNQTFTGPHWRDLFGHGEHIAGIIGANGVGSNCPSCTRTLKGIAPNVNLINLRVLDHTGQGDDSDVIAAIDTAISLKGTYNIRVINLSLGRPVFESYTVDPLCHAVEAAWKAGIVVVVAAGNNGRDNSLGNNGYGTVNAPGNDPYVITVGAMNTHHTFSKADDTIASYSSKGPTLIDHLVKPDLVAPGNRVVSLRAPGTITLGQDLLDGVLINYLQSIVTGVNANATSNYYLMLSGTSMATAVVSGACALLLQASPWLSPDQVKARLMRTASKAFPAKSTAQDPATGQIYVSYYDSFTVGAGYLDIQAALHDTTWFSGSAALSPVAIYTPSSDSSSGSVYLACNSSTVCATESIGGAKSIWGDQAIWGNGSLLATQSVWGTKSIWGDQTIWSTGSVVDSVSPSLSVLVQGEN